MDNKPPVARNNERRFINVKVQGAGYDLRN